MSNAKSEAVLGEDGNAKMSEPEKGRAEFRRLDPKEILERKKAEVFLSAIVDPGDFWVRLLVDPSAFDHNQMHLELKQAMCLEQSNTDVLAVGCPVGALFSGTWYRAEVLQFLDDDSVAVHFVDFGNESVLSVKEVKPLDESFVSYPALALRCCLKDALPPSGCWRSESLALFTNFLEKQFLCLFYEYSSEKEMYSVDLFGLKQDPIGNVKNLLADENAWAGMGLLAADLTPSVPFPRLDFPVDHTEPIVQCSFGRSLAEFYLHFPSLKDEMSQVIQLCEDVYTAGSLMPLGGLLVSGQSCMARFADDGSWYRAEVLEDLGPEGVSVVFVDFGNVLVCPRQDVQRVADDHLLLATPALAIRCCLQGIPDLVVPDFNDLDQIEFKTRVCRSSCTILAPMENSAFTVSLKKDNVDIDFSTWFGFRDLSAGEEEKVEEAVAVRPAPVERTATPEPVPVPAPAISLVPVAVQETHTITTPKKAKKGKRNKTGRGSKRKNDNWAISQTTGDGPKADDAAAPKSATDSATPGADGDMPCAAALETVESSLEAVRLHRKKLEIHHSSDAERPEEETVYVKMEEEKMVGAVEAKLVVKSEEQKEVVGTEKEKPMEAEQEMVECGKEESVVEGAVRTEGEETLTEFGGGDAVKETVMDLQIPEFPRKAEAEIRVMMLMDVEGAEGVWCSAAGAEFAEFRDHLFHHYSALMAQKAHVHRPEQGKFYVAEFTEKEQGEGDGEQASEKLDFHRVKLESVWAERGKVGVFFVDFGTRNLVALNSLFPLAPEFASLPAQAFQVRLPESCVPTVVCQLRALSMEDHVTVRLALDQPDVLTSLRNSSGVDLLQSCPG